MASVIQIPIANQITLIQRGLINYRNVYPNMFNSGHMTYQPNVHLHQYCQKFTVGMKLSFQLRSDTVPTAMLTEIIGGTEVPIGAINITPPSWAGLPVWEFSINLSVVGEYFVVITLDDVTLLSEPIIVTEDNRNVVRMEYSNDENDFGMVFTTNGIDFKTYSLLIDGRFDLVQPASTREQFETDLGLLSVQDVVPVVIFTAELSPLPSQMVNKLNYILGCKNIFLNQLRWNVREAPSVQRIDNSNMYQMLIQFQLADFAQSIASVEQIIIQAGDVIINDGQTPSPVVISNNP